MYPDTDRDLKISRCSGGIDKSSSDAYLGTQLASVSAHSLFRGSGKLRKLDMSFYLRVVNVIPRDLHSLKYFTMWRAVDTCDGVEECR